MSDQEERQAEGTALVPGNKDQELLPANIPDVSPEKMAEAVEDAVFWAKVVDSGFDVDGEIVPHVDVVIADYQRFWAPKYEYRNSLERIHEGLDGPPPDDRYEKRAELEMWAPRDVRLKLGLSPTGYFSFCRYVQKLQMAEKNLARVFTRLTVIEKCTRDGTPYNCVGFDKLMDVPGGQENSSASEPKPVTSIGKPDAKPTTENDGIPF